MAKVFTKGEQVTLIQKWDDDFVVTARKAIVGAAGEKRMTLVDALTGQCIGKDFTPTIDRRYDMKVIKNGADVEAEGLALSADMIRESAQLNASKLNNDAFNQEAINNNIDRLSALTPSVRSYHD